MFKADSEGTRLCLNYSETKRVFITMSIGQSLKRNPLNVPLGLDSNIVTIVVPVCVHYLGGLWLEVGGWP